MKRRAQNATGFLMISALVNGAERVRSRIYKCPTVSLAYHMNSGSRGSMCELEVSCGCIKSNAVTTNVVQAPNHLLAAETEDLQEVE
jgi:hypothetical protein